MSDTHPDLEPVNLLVVFANPTGTDTLRLQAEERVIRECLSLSQYGERVDLDVLPASTIHDVRRALLYKEYRIVHFSGHGTGQGLMFEDARGEPLVVPPEALAEFLGDYSPPIECVLLNACRTGLQGQLLSLGVPYTIAIGGSITDEAATEFTRGFYDAIAAGKDFEFAFREAYRTVKLVGAAADFKPVLFTEKRDEERSDMKIVSQREVTFDEEPGFLDYVLDGVEGFEEVTEIAQDISQRTAELGAAIEEDTAALDSLGSSARRPALRESKRIVDRAAHNMESFAQHLDGRIPAFRDAYSKAVDSYGKAATLLTTEFEEDPTQQIEEALGVLGALQQAIIDARIGMGALRASIASLPRMTKTLNHAKRRSLSALDSFGNEMEDGLELTERVKNKMQRLLR
jgi:hypothetical protein